MIASIFASGSGGNCMLLSSDDTNILIDAGISMRRIENSLSRAEITLDDISGVLITHEHSDHISGLKMLIKHHPLPIYAPHTVANRIIGQIPDAQRFMNIIVPGRDFCIGDMTARCFHTPHDTDESVGYRVSCGGVFAIATDMGHVTREVEDNLLHADAVVIEANHDEEMLRYGPYPVYLKRRILSDRGHLSNECCAELARKLSGSGTVKIILGHISKENNTPEKAMSVVRGALDGYNSELYCAPSDGFLTFSIGESV